MFKLTANGKFTTALQVLQQGDVTVLQLDAACENGADKLEMILEWQMPDIGVHLCWDPAGDVAKRVMPHWGRASRSNISCSAPVLSCLSYDDTNRLTMACSDSKNLVQLLSGVIEENACMLNTVRISVECAVSRYSCQVRIDTRALPFYKCVQDVAAWWEGFDGHTPVAVPEIARQPLYSAWYSFHQNIDIPRILEECRYFHALGCRSIIVDDGWQTDDNNRGYAYCGDWEATPSKIPDMKAFVDAVHETGMKFILWYSVPFVGVHSRAYKRFENKILHAPVPGETYVLDPRYPDVRQYLIDTYKKAALEWGLDGFKLDFIDSFTQSDTVKDGMDYVSVYDAVDRLMKDVMHELKTIRSDILIEFRQEYIGPLMRSFGNMFRASDCPNDSYLNRMRTLALRMTSGNTAVHSDMVMWNYAEPAELAAFQLTNILFSVPQISVLHDKMPEPHRKMVERYLQLWTRYRSVLLDGELTMRGYGADYTFVAALLGDTQVGAVYNGRIATLDSPAREIVVFNATLNSEVVLEAGFTGSYSYTVTDCTGSETASGCCTLGSEFVRINVPLNGVLTLTAE